QYLTVAEVVQSGRHASIGLNEAASAADRAAARRVMREFDLLPLATRTLRELSYGQLRRALFARAWVRRPALLVLDEPFAGLDVSTHEDLRARVERLASGGGRRGHDGSSTVRVAPLCDPRAGAGRRQGAICWSGAAQSSVISVSKTDTACPMIQTAETALPVISSSISTRPGR
ncbi:ABC transporter-like domain protein, partial [mine drainage metagenome]